MISILVLIRFGTNALSPSALRLGAESAVEEAAAGAGVCFGLGKVGSRSIFSTFESINK